MIPRRSARMRGGFNGPVSAARWLTFAVCFAWLAASVWWSHERQGVRVFYDQLIAFGPPIGCLLVATALLRSARSPSDASPVTHLEEAAGRLDRVIITFNEQLSAAIGRAEQVSGRLAGSEAASLEAAGRVQSTLDDLSRFLLRVDELSKGTTSAVSKRAYALDAALDGVLGRAEHLFADLDEQLRSRAVEASDRLQLSASALLADVSAEVSALTRQLNDIRETAVVGRAVPVGENTSNAPTPIDQLSITTDYLSRLLATPSGEPITVEDSTVFPQPDDQDLTAPSTRRFLVAFEKLVGRVLAWPGSDRLAAKLLNSELGRFYQALARRDGRIR